MDKPNIEIRNCEHNITFEVRNIKDTGEQFVVEGLAAPFNERANIGGWFYERYNPGCFERTINDSKNNIKMYVEHRGLPLASFRSDTLHLFESERGLEVEASLHNSDPDVQSVRYKIERRDLDKMSIAFTIEKANWVRQNDGMYLHDLTDVNLREVSIVDRPAYKNTDISAKTRSELEAIKPIPDSVVDHYTKRYQRMNDFLTAKKL